MRQIVSLICIKIW